MAKATKAADKKSKTPMKTSPKTPAKAPAKAGKPAPKPAAKPASKNGKGPSQPPPKATKPTVARTESSPRTENKQAKAAASAKFDPSELRAHPEAKLTQKELTALYTKLFEEKARVVNGFEKHVQEALSDDDVLADEIDIAQRSTDQAWLFRFADKERKLLIEIDAAIEKMRNGDYGVCEGTDEAIGFKRLELRPWTRYSVAYKEMLEREKAQQAR
jgi:DnaK suppressor protein